MLKNSVSFYRIIVQFHHVLTHLLILKRSHSKLVAFRMNQFPRLAALALYKLQWAGRRPQQMV